MEDKNKKSALTITVVVIALLLFLPILFCWLVASFVGSAFTNAVPIAGISLIILLSFVAHRVIFGHWIKLGIIIPALIIVACIALMEGGNYYNNVYLPSITVQSNPHSPEEYKPFTDSPLLSHLDEEATLHFTDDLPVIDGATALLPVYCSVAEAVYPPDVATWYATRLFQEENAEPQKIIIDYTNTKGAYNALIHGERDVIFVAPPSKEQREAAAEAGVELNLTPIGYEAFVFLVNKENPVEDLSFEQIKAIYTGKITNWKEVGGKNLAIRPFQRDTNSGSQTAFLHFIGEDANLIPPETKQVITGMGGLVDKVADYQNHKNAIGYSFRYYVETMLNNANVKLLAINGVAPTAENIANHTYPLSDTFCAVTLKGRETENTKRLIEWLLSEQGQELIARTGYIRL